ncbi:MAG: hypothetical protein AAF533_17155 [Acidobacteriota bacterium]
MTEPASSPAAGRDLRETVIAALAPLWSLALELTEDTSQAESWATEAALACALHGPEGDLRLERAARIDALVQSSGRLDLLDRAETWLAARHDETQQRLDESTVLALGAGDSVPLDAWSQALRELPWSLRFLLRAHVLQGLSAVELAIGLGADEQRVGRCLRRARLALLGRALEPSAAWPDDDALASRPALPPEHP